MSDRILIVADDLTGACDSAAAFLALGRTVRVLLDPAGIGNDAEIVAITTESRDLAASHAAERVWQSVDRLLSRRSGALLFKKIDSAARGPFAVETAAALGASRAALALISPAFPAAGRTVTNGVLTIRDLSGQDTQVSLPEVFYDCDVAPLTILPASSESDLHNAIMRAIDDGIHMLLCDATDQSDLNRLAAAALRIPQPILWAGSAGLAYALAAQLPREAHAAAAIPRRAGRTVLFTGTPHPVTTLQVEHLERASRHLVLERSRTIHRIPDSGATPEAVISAFEAAAPAALVLTGGDTAAFVLRALGATSIRLAGEVAPGIPWGMIEGGLADGCTVVTKSGGFGQQDALVRAFEFCESEFCESACCESEVSSKQ